MNLCQSKVALCNYVLYLHSGPSQPISVLICKSPAMPYLIKKGFDVLLFLQKLSLFKFFFLKVNYEKNVLAKNSKIFVLNKII